MDFAELTLLVMISAWFLPMAVLVAFLMWRHSVPELDAWVDSTEFHAQKAGVHYKQERATFSYDLNSIDVSRVTPNMLKPKVSSKLYAASAE